MLISVIIPTFNRRIALEKAVRSVLNQKSPPFELIVADDGSTDGTAKWLAREFPEVHLLRWDKQQGPSYARNRAAEAAHGNWLAFLDSDDEWTPDKLTLQAAFLIHNPRCRIVQTEETWIRNGVRVNPMNKHRKYGGAIFEKCLPLCIISPSAVVLEKALFEEMGGFDESLPACEDYDLWLRITARYPVGLIEKPCVIKYGGHADQRSREFPVMDRFRIQALEKILTSGTLSEEQTAQARAMLDEKSRIVLAGALKRNNTAEAGQMRALREKHALQESA